MTARWRSFSVNALSELTSAWQSNAGRAEARIRINYRAEKSGASPPLNGSPSTSRSGFGGWKADVERAGTP